ncbi:hypothetical protein [Micromonospora maris]|uniref:Uncharacterized protein n=1 Tax=Micromonospora maris TaxID=1003110 RepID=A0A9X0I7I8_9ACTN|nr:hypothetical protein [Micromonospora maris]AEB43135.1 hypothetical protein VAB18032_10085 [Micromonospora maris AB-18-032]KUJ48500.1 hypothetical protein ADL17_05505 [Micromonospora maris]
MSSTTLHSSPPRRSLWRRLVDWWRGEEQPFPAPPPAPMEEVIYQPAGDGAVITALCAGDVFEFQVHTDLVWASREMSYATLTEQAREFGSSARDTVRERIWAVARTFSPYHCAEAEKAIQKELDGDWCYSGPNGKVRCRAKVRVLPDPRVREHLLPYALQQLDVEARATLGLLQAARFEMLTERWRDLLHDLGHDAKVGYAAQLTDADFAAVVGRYANHHRASVLELADVLRQAGKDHERVGMYEFANAYDKAVQAFCKQMGLDDRSWPVVDGDPLPKATS